MIAVSSSVSVPPLVSHRTSVRAPGLAGRPKVVERVAAVGLVAVEEVLGVVDRLAPAVGDEADRVRDHVEVLLRRGAEDLGHVEQPRLAEDRHDRRLGRDQLAQVGVLRGRVGAMSRRAERRELGRLPAHRPGRGEELDVLGVGARPAALDVGHAVLVEHPRDAQLVGQRERDVLALGAVAQGRVVEDDRRGRHADGGGHAGTPAASSLDDGGREAVVPTTTRPSVAVAGIREVAGPAAVVERRAARPPRWRGRDVVAPERPAEQHRARQDRADRVGHVLARDVRRRAVDRLVQPEHAVRRPALAERRRRQHPQRSRRARDASSDRMSPNMFSVTMTSKCAGRVTSSIAHESTSRCSTSTSGYSASDLLDDLAPQAADDASTFALSTLVTPAAAGRGRARTRAGRCARSRARVYGSVSTASAPSGVAAAPPTAGRSRAPPVSSRTISRSTPSSSSGRSGDDATSAGCTVTGRRLRVQPKAAAQREERLLRAGRRRSGRPTSGRRPRRGAPRRPRGSARRPRRGSRRRRRRSRRRRRGPRPSRSANPNRSPAASRTRRAGGHDLRPDAVARDGDERCAWTSTRPSRQAPRPIRGPTNADLRRARSRRRGAC